jgi:hypothetical protein
MGFIHKLGNVKDVIINGVGADHPIPPGYSFNSGEPAADAVTPAPPLSPSEALKAWYATLTPDETAFAMAHPAFAQVGLFALFGNREAVLGLLQAMAPTISESFTPKLMALVTALGGDADAQVF